jgi:CHAD domain-containing protein
MTLGVASRLIERELKFAVDRDYDPPDFRDVVGRTERLPEQQTVTVYYDTRDRRLRDRGITLRHRVGEGSERGTWTLKLPQGGEGLMLNRAELSWDGERGEVPEEAARILRGVVRRSVLTELVELHATRRRLLLRNLDDADPWGEIDDDIVAVVGGPKDGLRFRQIEVELRPGTPAVAEAVIDGLRRSGTRPTRQGKLALALGERSSRKGVSGRKSGSHHGRPLLVDTIYAAIRSGLDRLLDHDYRLRVDAEKVDPHDVHQARVATRRLRSDLRTFGAALDPVWLRHTTEDLRWIGTALGRVRDVDVLAQHMDEEMAPIGSSVALPEFTQRLRAQRSRAALELSTALVDERYINLLDRLHAAALNAPLSRGPGAKHSAPHRSARKALPSIVGHRWRSLERAVDRSGSQPSDHDLHRIRIKAKRLRYAADTAVPVIGAPAARTADAAERAQELLGELHDAVTGEEWVRRQVAESTFDPRTAFAAGAVCRDLQLRQESLRAQWKEEWKRIRRKRNRAWLR